MPKKYWLFMKSFNDLEEAIIMSTGKWSPLVSIVIPVYNGSNYLREALDSALAQTYENLEILVINDGSNDGGATEQTALSYGDKIRYFYKENGGTPTALNLGIENMRGEYFSWLSHDDLYYPQKISRAIEELSKLDDKDTIIISDFDAINEDFVKFFSTAQCQEHRDAYPKRNDFRLYPIIYNKTHGCTHLFSKKVFETVGLFDTKWLVAHDSEFYFRAFSAFPHLYINEVLVTARESSNRQGKRSRTLCNIEYSLLYIKMIKQLSEDDILQIAPSIEEFLLDMEQFLSYADYSIALEYVEVLAESKGIKTVLGRRDTTNIPTQHNPHVSTKIEEPRKTSRYNIPVRFICGLKRHGLRKFLRLFFTRLMLKLKKTHKT